MRADGIETSVLVFSAIEHRETQGLLLKRSAFRTVLSDLKRIRLTRLGLDVVEYSSGPKGRFIDPQVLLTGAIDKRLNLTKYPKVHLMRSQIFEIEFANAIAHHSHLAAGNDYSFLES